MKKRSWVTQLRRMMQSAREQISTQFHRIPQKARFVIVTFLFSIITTVFVSHFPLSVVPEYRPGEIAKSDVIVPADLMAKDEAHPSGASQIFKHNPYLLRAGEVVTAEKLPLIDAVRRSQIEQRDPKHLGGLLVLILLMNFALYKAAITSQSSRLGPRTGYWVASSAIMIQTLLVRAGMFGAAVLSTSPETMGFANIFEFQLAIPFAACALVLSLLIGSQVALVAGLMSAILVGFISPHGLTISAFALAGSITAIYSVQRYRTRNAVILASASVCAVNVGMGLITLLIANHEWAWQRVAGGVVLCLFGALLTAATASLAIPIYEWLFDILTDMRLLELSNADNPLLRQLAIQTPGTNHHSFMVGMLAEEAAKAIGANVLLARTGCLYHDIGKMAAPNMYIENQKGGPNPHDKVSPLNSVRIITGHVRRGIQMAKDADLPQQIIDFIPQHHGTRVLAYFYHKAKSQSEAGGEAVNMDDFRYPGPKPQSKEAVILMLADGAEASVRSLDEPTPESIRAIIKKIVDSVVADGQLDDSNITMKELTTIRESLINTLISVYHQRISYPGFNPPPEAVGVTEEASEIEKQMAMADVNGIPLQPVSQTNNISQEPQQKRQEPQRAKLRRGQ
ncbi:MAG: HDIG domain-containing protein [Acidobacteria bacterium]|nr:HDIG domain-containing protein [Acidobacteriota bacterium]